MAATPQPAYLPGLEPTTSASSQAPPLAPLAHGLLTRDQVLHQFRQLRQSNSTRAAKWALVRWRARNDLLWFGSTFLGLAEYLDPVNGRPRVDPAFHGELCEHLAARKSILLLLPRDHGKSTWVTVAVAQDLLTNPEHIRTLIISASVTLARARLRYLADLLTRPTVLYYFSDIVPEPGRAFTAWETKNAYDLTITKPANRLLAQHQVMVCGWEALITGHHFDHIVCDDIIDAKTARSETKRQLAAEQLTALRALLEPTGRFTIVGTRYHEDDVYSRLLKSAMLQVHLIRQATERPAHRAHEPLPAGTVAGSLDDPAAEPVYAFYDREMLRKAQQDSYDLTGRHEWFFTQYYNLSSAPEEAVFPNVASGTYDQIPTNVRESCKVYLTLDTANTQHAHSDYNAIAVGYHEPHGTLYIDDSANVRGTWEDAVLILIAMAIKHKPISIGVETLFGDNWLAMYNRVKRDYQRDWLSRRAQISPIPTPMILTPRRGQSKAERVDLLFGVAFRTGAAVVQRDQAELLAQMEAFPKGRYDDLVDASASLIALAEPKQRIVTYYDTPQPPHQAEPLTPLMKYIRGAGSADYRYGQHLVGYR